MKSRSMPLAASTHFFGVFLELFFFPHTQRPQNAPGDRRSMPLATSTHGSTHGYLQPQHSSQPAPLQHSSPHAAGAICFGFLLVFFLVRFRFSFPLSFFFSTVVFFFAAVVFFFNVAPSPILLLGNVLLFFVYPPHSSAWHTLWRTVGAAMKVVLSVFVHVHVRIHIRICMHIHII